MTGPPKRGRGAAKHPSDQLTIDQVPQYSNTPGKARPELRIAFSRPDWLWPLEHREHRPVVKWQGNVAHVDLRPVGLRMVEIQPGEWVLAFYYPHAPKAKRCSKFSSRGMSFDVVESAILDIRAETGRPVWPPLAYGVAA